MVSRRIQRWVRQLVMRLMTPFARLGITPNMLTVTSLLLSILAAVVITQGFLVIGGLLVLLAGTFDMFDGAMARVRNASTSFGAFFDSTLDRYSESIILLGLLVYALQRSPDYKEPLWPTSHEQTWMILFLYMAMVGSCWHIGSPRTCRYPGSWSLIRYKYLDAGLACCLHKRNRY